jgi:hypothetical protein
MTLRAPSGRQGGLAFRIRTAPITRRPTYGAFGRAAFEALCIVAFVAALALVL